MESNSLCSLIYLISCSNIDTKAFFMIVVCYFSCNGFGFKTLSMVIIMVPVLLPAAMAMGVDPIWFGIFMVIMVERALITSSRFKFYVIQSVANSIREV